MISICLPSVELFNVLTALFCHRLLAPHMSNESAIYWTADFQHNFKFLATAANDAFETGYQLVPDIDNATNMQMVCSGLTRDDCQRWLACSRAGSDCCKRHLARNMTTRVSAAHCKAIWDGISCFDSTPNGTAVDLECPSYYIPTEGSGNWLHLLYLLTISWSHHVGGGGAVRVKKNCLFNVYMYPLHTRT